MLRRPYNHERLGKIVGDFEEKPIARRYRLLERLGKGGLGTVYKAVDTRIQRLVALKLIPLVSPHDSASTQRFHSHAQTVERLVHPNIVQLYDWGEADGVSYTAYQLIEGRDLSALLREQRVLEPAYAVEIARQVALALVEIHQHGIIHRDIKPSNILISTTGRVLLADFDLAQTPGTSVTEIGTILGTPLYMSPEQAMGVRLDARTDIFSLGGVLYKCLTGEHPFSGATMGESMVRLVDDNPRSPLEFNSKISPELASIVLKMMHKDPDRRFPSAQDVVQALSVLPPTSFGPSALNPVVRSGLDPAVGINPARGEGFAMPPIRFDRPGGKIRDDQYTPKPPADTSEAQPYSAEVTHQQFLHGVP